MAAASSHLDLGGGTKRRRKEEEVEAGVEAAEDHISELPEALRLHVLCLLPLKSAIRTGALSTGWRSLWTRRWPAPSSLDFHLGTHDSPHPLLETLERRGRRRLQRFALSFDIGELQAEHFRRCLEYAAACAVEDLHVHLAHSVFNIFFNYRLPLGDPHLARLSLGAMTVGLPDSFSARSHPFSALEVIHLHCVRISDGTLRSLVAACPLLHTLDLRYCEGLYFISVAAAGARPRSLTVAQCGSDTEVFLADDASGLRSFHYSGAYMPAYRIPATTALADLYICFGGPERRGRRRNWLQLLTNLSNLTVLTLCSRVLRRLSAEARARLVATSAAPCKLLNLRELQLLMFALEIDNMNDIYCFLVTCCGPRLERLFVQLPTSSYQDKPEDEPSGSESEEDGSVEELSEQEASDEDELDEHFSEGETLEKDGLEEELSEGDALEEELSEGDELEEELLEGDDLEEELLEGIELEEELSEGEPPEENQSQKHGSMEEISDGDGFENLLLVNMMNIKGRHNEMQLVSLFLKKSTSLNQLILFTPKIDHPEWLQKDHMNTSHILDRKLSPLRKASPNVQIVLSEPDDSAIQPLHEAFVKV
ncbi:uncharacterized protein [Aegilops tauschii subsp. strangulata]|nr:uncharacterized protein LOC109779672 [Aegilops tauschii subsp. strangulata]XP_045086899.1 uncharacterized protein LOC109779672 [Aegilops tauschii subsp. strangulata]XP_045086900.1 uncharacterized protein LOC109779672 [Aegilops tauschii subsp. strangulata]